MTKIVKLPGLIDVHVHLRYLDPQKENFETGTKAALAGGFTTVLDMPNNKIPITTLERLEEKIETAKKDTKCDIGFHFGSLGDNLEEFEKVKDKVCGLKLYLNQTTGGFIIDEEKLRNIFIKWNQVTEGKRPILLHAEADVLGWVSKIVKETKQPTHICHISSEEELTDVLNLKQQGLPITCGVTPQHLFLTDEDAKKLGPYGLVKPAIKSKKDQDFLWKNFSQIDLIESDHAPHTKQEKEGPNPPFGMTGLETTLPLLLTAMSEGRITEQDIIDKCFNNPKQVFHLPDQENTNIEVDLDEKYTISGADLFTKAKSTPFEGMEVQGKVKKVTLRGQVVFENGEFLGTFGQIISPVI